MAQITLNSTGVASNGSLVLQSNGTTAAVTIDTSQRVAFVAGTAALPAITTTGDTNTGIFFPAADTVAIATGGTEIARIDSSGNLGLGVTPSATWNSAFKVTEIKGAGNAFFAGGSGWTLMSSNAFYGASNWQYGATGNLATAYEQFNGTHVFKIAPNNAGAAGATCNFTNAMTLDASGNLGVGTTSPTQKLSIGFADASSGFLEFRSATYAKLAQIEGADDNAGGNGHLSFYTRNVGTIAEKARIDTSGNLLVGTTSTAGTVVGARMFPTGLIQGTRSESTNAATQYDVYSTGAAAYRFYVGMGGTIYATSTTISAISDIRFKENVRDLDAGLSEVMALKPRLYDWKEGKGADTKNARGFIAQEFEEVFPDLIDEWKDPAPEGEEPYKSVRQDLIPVLVKAIQELKAEIDSLKSQLNGA